MGKIRVLIVAPYEGLKEQVLSMAEQYPDFSFEIVVADLDEALVKLKPYDIDSYFAVISRGGTARVIQKHYKRFVFNLEISGLDILRLVMFARNHPGKAVIIGFDLITRYCRMICDLMQVKIDIHTIDNEAQAASILDSFDNAENVLVLGDAVSTKIAARRGMPNLLILSGRESIEHVLEEVRNNYSLIFDCRKRNDIYRAIQSCAPNNVYLFNSKGELQPESTDDPVFSADLIKYIPQIADDKAKSFVLTVDSGDSFIVNGSVLDGISESEPYIVFYVQKMNLRAINSAITLFSDYDINKSDFNLFSTENEQLKTALNSAHDLAPTASTVLIEGERGTGKTLMAKLIHSESALKDHLLVQIDCSLLCNFEKIWQRDLSKILEADKVTVYMKNFHRLDANEQLSLEQHLPQISKHRIIISSERSLYEMANSGKLNKDLISQLDFVQIWLPPLRERKNEIQSCFYLLLTKMNQRFGTQVVGIEKPALDMLEAYRWTGNFDQFRHVISNAVQKEGADYIRKSTIATLLSVYNQAHWSRKVYTGRTLQEIEQDIVIATLQEMNMNQSLAAKKLGISRTTLWRILKNTSANEGTLPDEDNSDIRRD